MVEEVLGGELRFVLWPVDARRSRADLDVLRPLDVAEVRNLVQVARSGDADGLQVLAREEMVPFNRVLLRLGHRVEEVANADGSLLLLPLWAFGDHKRRHAGIEQ